MGDFRLGQALASFAQTAAGEMQGRRMAQQEREADQQRQQQQAMLQQAADRQQKAQDFLQMHQKYQAGAEMGKLIDPSAQGQFFSSLYNSTFGGGAAGAGAPAGKAPSTSSYDFSNSAPNDMGTPLTSPGGGTPSPLTPVTGGLMGGPPAPLGAPPGMGAAPPRPAAARPMLNFGGQSYPLADPARAAAYDHAILMHEQALSPGARYPVRDPLIRARTEQALAALRQGKSSGADIGSHGLGPAGLGGLNVSQFDPKYVEGINADVIKARDKIFASAQGLDEGDEHRAGIEAFLRGTPNRLGADATPEDIAAAQDWVRKQAPVWIEHASAAVVGKAKDLAARDFGKIQAANKQLAVPGKPPEYYTTIAGQMHALAKTPGVQKYYADQLGELVPPSLDPTPQQVTRKVRTSLAPWASASPEPGTAEPGPNADMITEPMQERSFQENETPAEVKARQLAAAAEYATDPKEKRRMLTDTVKPLIADFRANWKSMTPEGRQGLLGTINGYLDKLGGGRLPDDLTPVLTPQERQMMQERANARQLRSRGLDQQKEANGIRDRLATVAEDRLALSTQEHTDLQAHRAQQQAAKAKPGTAKPLTDPQRQTMGLAEMKSVLGQIKLMTSDSGEFGAVNDALHGDEPAYQRRKNAALGPLNQRVTDLRSALGPLVNQQFPEVFGPAPAAAAGATGATAPAPSTPGPGAAAPGTVLSPGAARALFIQRAQGRINQKTGRPFTRQEAEHVANGINQRFSGGPNRR